MNNQIEDNNIINWLNNWFASNSDGDWEHENQISIYTVDNPGWCIRIDLRDTPLENLKIEVPLVDKGPNNWYGITVKNGVFQGVGDLSKLSFLILQFKKLVTTYNGNGSNEGNVSNELVE